MSTKPVAEVTWRDLAKTMTHSGSRHEQMFKRLKGRLELAQFKVAHGLERCDLYTLKRQLGARGRRAWCQLNDSYVRRSRRPFQTYHRYYPTTVTARSMAMPAACRPTHTLLLCPLSAKRSTSPQPSLDTNDEVAARLLVMLKKDATGRHDH